MCFFCFPANTVMPNSCEAPSERFNHAYINHCALVYTLLRQMRRPMKCEPTLCLGAAAMVTIGDRTKQSITAKKKERSSKFSGHCIFPFTFVKVCLCIHLTEPLFHVIVIFLPFLILLYYLYRAGI